MLALSSHPMLNMMLDMESTLACPRYVSNFARLGPEFSERAAEYTCKLTAPGVSKDEIKIEAHDGVLKLELGGHMMWRKSFPRDADFDAATATYVDGILTVSIPKKELEDEHEGFTCDVTEQPIVGKRYHLPGHNYDICDAAFQKLGPREKALYECILPPPKRVRANVPVLAATAADSCLTAGAGLRRFSATAADKSPGEEDKEEEATPRPYTLSLNAAGVRAADIHLTIDGNLLSVSGSTGTTGSRVPKQAYKLPRDADAEKAHATSIDGILTVTIPKKLVPTTTIEILGAPTEKEEEEAAAAAPAAGATAAADEDAVMV